MKIIRATTAGFCMGVSLALQKLETELEQARVRICTLGPIIHNPQVLESFARRGVICLNEPEEARPGDIVLIRAHGITRQMEQTLRARGALVRDATCPRVKKAQLAIRAATKNAELLLFGEEQHPEVRGLVSCAQGGAHVFSSRGELERIPLRPEAAYVLASQTTQDRKIFAEIENALAGKLPRLEILRTICDATRQRQEEAREIASRVEAMVIVGGRESGNTRRLAHLAAQAGVCAFHIETCRELRREDFLHRTCVGLTAGASTPKSLIDETENWLRQACGEGAAHG